METAIRVTIGFILKIFGIIWSLTANLICSAICKGQCNQLHISKCSFLLLFVGIIFIVCGYALIILKGKKKNEKKKIIRKEISNLIR